eukprot:TRINITY_DN49003_c0_g2_i3.p1 TRINITY_DN49003_c0_g2~~TRINITY_DN49003_c0_g2_i3.p1  ORF type:complete len:201 (+),score=16.94 TRINITY_DN49003_c0_g2_i3:64-603(+)
MADRAQVALKLDEARKSRASAGEYLSDICEKDGFSAAAPQSIYGAVALMPLLSRGGGNGSRGAAWFSSCGVNYLSLLGNFAIQLSFLYGISQIASVEKSLILNGDCDVITMEPWLVCLCVAVYLMFVANDFEGTFTLAELYFDLIPTAHGSSEPLKFEGNDMVLVSGGLSWFRKATLPS